MFVACEVGGEEMLLNLDEVRRLRAWNTTDCDCDCDCDCDLECERGLFRPLPFVAPLTDLGERGDFTEGDVAKTDEDRRRF